MCPEKVEGIAGGFHPFRVAGCQMWVSPQPQGRRLKPNPPVWYEEMGPLGEMN